MRIKWEYCEDTYKYIGTVEEQITPPDWVEPYRIILSLDATNCDDEFDAYVVLEHHNYNYELDCKHFNNVTLEEAKYQALNFLLDTVKRISNNFRADIEELTELVEHENLTRPCVGDEVIIKESAGQYQGVQGVITEFVHEGVALVKFDDPRNIDFVRVQNFKFEDLELIKLTRKKVTIIQANMRSDEELKRQYNSLKAAIPFKNYELVTNKNYSEENVDLAVLDSEDLVRYLFFRNKFINMLELGVEVYCVQIENEQDDKEVSE